MRTAKKDSKPAATKDKKVTEEAAETKEIKLAPIECEQEFTFKENVAYSVKTVAKMLEINTSKINEWITKGLLPCLNIGHRIVLHEDLMNFLKRYRGYDISKPDNIEKLPFYENDDSNLGA